MKKDEKLRKTVPVRLTDTMLDEVKRAARKLSLSEQDAFRMLIAIGLVCLEKTGYYLPEHIAEKALSK